MEKTGKRLGLILLIAAIILIGASIAYAMRGSAKKTEAGFKPAPDFSLKKANGETVRISDWKDQVVVVHFWASWCPPCVPEIPEILAAAKKLPKDKSGRPIHWLLISEDQTWEKAHTILKEETLPENVSLVLDPEAKISDLFGTYQFPETYLVLRDGGLAAKWIGAQDWTGKWGDSVLDAIENASRSNKIPASPNP